MNTIRKKYRIVKIKAKMNLFGIYSTCWFENKWSEKMILFRLGEVIKLDSAYY